MQLNPTQNLAVDLLILIFDKSNNGVKIFTPTHEDLKKKALPRVLLKPNESISDAVKRPLEIKTSFSELIF